MDGALNFALGDSPIQLVREWKDNGISLHIKREDLLHPEVSGNKFRKLKYNLQEARAGGKSRILTFGGAYSNHIAAVAAAGNLLGIKTTGVIRGEELGENRKKTLAENPTLRYAAQQGMELIYISREEYRRKQEPEIQEKLKALAGDFYLIPEGGTNELAVKGCEEILNAETKKFNYICCAVGTGGTVSGLINAAEEDQVVLGFPALKGNFFAAEIEKYTRKKNWKLVNHYHFGGYAKVSRDLIDFINTFREQYHIMLDPVYTGKMVFGIFDMIKRSAFPDNSRILAVHTGGLQGITGMNRILRNKNYPIIKV